ncbi:ATP-dependent zinc protease family protein [Marinimicrobium alkaliphilum]|uniref:ATP-dependent zinc protease family protein n=1 Tax=Marinimicrobium alkaliphilum TaxID=2202654 RepID=UPI000DBA2FCB|nr:RimK/LysX family protein [Marinimicrobium alkaliphilum]
MKYLPRSLVLLAAAATLAACSSTDRVLVKKADFEAAEQCLMAQAQYQPILEAQQQQLGESLKLLRDSFELHKEYTSLREFLTLAEERREQIECPQPAEPHYQQQLTDRQLDMQIVGEIENVLFTNEDIIMRARIDTGATTSSLDARDIQTFERNGDNWVRFTVRNPETGEDQQFERQRARGVRIIQASAEEAERRPVVEMRITLGRITQVAEFTLSDRSNLEFPVLIGRNILRDVMMVDVSKQNFAPLVPPETSDRNGRGSE